MLVPVSVDSWQIECCLEPFSIGELVTWGLLFDEAPSATSSSPSNDVSDIEAAASATSLDAVEGYPYPVSLTRGGLRLFWAAPRPVHGQVHLTGTIREDHHVDLPTGHPRTAGTVRRIRVVTRDHRQADSGTWVPTSDPPRYRDVSTCPRRFSWPDHDTPVLALQTGVLVDLDVED